MKKLITLALALVMILAIAAPAFATVGFTPQPSAAPTPAPAKGPIKVEVELYEFKESTPSSGGWPIDSGKYYKVYDTSIGIRAKDELRFAVKVTVPAQDAFSGDPSRKALLTLNVNNLSEKPVYVAGAVEDDIAPAFEAVAGKAGTFSATKEIEIKNKEQKFTYMYTGIVAATADVTVSATIAGGQNTLPVLFHLGANDYRITGTNKDSFKVEINEKAFVRFKVNASDLVTNVFVSDPTVDNGKEYEALQDTGGQVVFRNGGELSAADTKKLKDALDTVFNLFGFTWGQTGYMYESAILAKFSTGYTVSASKIYKAYNADLKVPDPNAKPPKTGDTTSSVGFVMIAIALVAAAAVTFKKVRA